jgi:hypothetical protein
MSRTSASDYVGPIARLCDEYGFGLVAVQVREVTFDVPIKAKGKDYPSGWQRVVLEETLFPALFIEALGRGLAAMSKEDV